METEEASEATEEASEATEERGAGSCVWASCAAGQTLTGGRADSRATPASAATAISSTFAAARTGAAGWRTRSASGTGATSSTSAGARPSRTALARSAGSSTSGDYLGKSRSEKLLLVD